LVAGAGVPESAGFSAAATGLVAGVAGGGLPEHAANSETAAIPTKSDKSDFIQHPLFQV
jgi:hypothetical protein